MSADFNLDVSVPTCALERAVAKERATSEDGVIYVEGITVNMMHPKERYKILRLRKINLMQDIIASRDKEIDTMCRAELIVLAGDLAQVSDKTTCKSHWD